MGVQVVSRRQEPVQREEKVDPWERVLQGIQIAGGITGVAVDFQNFQDLKEKRAVRQRREEGVFNVPEQLELSKSGFDIGPEQEGPQPPDAIGFQTPEGQRMIARPGLTPEQKQLATEREDARKVKAIADREALKLEEADKLFDMKQDFRKDKLVVKAIEKHQTGEFVNELLKKEAAVIDSVALRQIFRLSGDVGAIRENDLRDLGADPSLIEQAKLFTNRLTIGQRISPDDRKLLSEMSSAVQATSRRDVNRIATDLANSGAARIKGMNSKELLEFLDPAAQFPEAQAVAPSQGIAAQPPSQDVPQPDPQDVEAELIRRGLLQPRGGTAQSSMGAQ
jgi:hypothetical protein